MDAKRLTLSILVSALILFFNNCDKFSGVNSAATTFANLKVKELGRGTYPLASGFEYQLLKIESPNQAPVLVQWIPSSGEAAGPAVVIMDPYSGIGWSDLEVDGHWASRPGATVGYQHADEDGPGYDALSSKPINYRLSTPEEAASQGAFFLLNKTSVLIVYGRFYAGGNLQKYISDVTIALEFLSMQKEVNPNRVGLFGISWGGFQAVYGAAHSSGLRPAAGVAVAPPTDFPGLVEYGYSFLPGRITNSTVLASYLDFFEPYMRRIRAASPVPFTAFTTAELSQRLNTQFLLIHDTWDTLIPVHQSSALYQQSSGKVDVYYFPHDTPISYNTFERDHQQSSEGMTFDSLFPVAQIYLLNRLLDSLTPKTIYYSNTSFTNSLIYLRQRQVNGADITWLKPRLAEFCVPGVQLYDLATNQKVSGPYFLSVVMAAWGWSQTESTICSYLSSHSL